MPKPAAPLAVHLRICSSRGPLFGPGKRELLARIDETASLALAARAMAMSYMRAWTLVRQMNREWRAPLVELRRGGNRRGGASLTATGRDVLALYDAIAAETTRAARPFVRKLARLR